MKTLSLHQPWATLLFTPQPSHHIPDGFTPQSDYGRSCDGPIVKRIETRSWPCPPHLIGQPLAIHATKRKPEHCSKVGDWVVLNQADGVARMNNVKTSQWIDLPLGAVIGSCRITACLPIVTHLGTADYDCPFPCVAVTNSRELLYVMRGRNGHRDITYISDQLPYGDFTPGRWAWVIEDAAPTIERCPWCWGEGSLDAGCHDVHGRPLEGRVPCPACWDGEPTKPYGVCEPIPLMGRQRIWSWAP